MAERYHLPPVAHAALAGLDTDVADVLVSAAEHATGPRVKHVDGALLTAWDEASASLGRELTELEALALATCVRAWLEQGRTSPAARPEPVEVPAWERSARDAAWYDAVHDNAAKWRR